MRNYTKERNVGNALTIQLLGSVDDMVSPEDNIDLISGRDFIYLDVPYTGHENIIEMHYPHTSSNKKSVASNNSDSKTLERANIFRGALAKTKDVLMQESIIPSDLPPEAQRRNVTDVVFVIHGIRDEGYWTHKVARRILLLARKQHIDGSIFATETSSYGYFPMLPFVLPTKRREKVEWLMDQYAESLALYPNAEYSYVGHSNGTYLLARALLDYPVCRFKNVVLAGSVIRTNYDWSCVISRGQVKNILNYVATADWVVALFPRAIQMLRFQDLGSAGHDGFNPASLMPGVFQIEYVKGNHSAALDESNWDSIAEFVLTGNPQPLPPNINSSKPSMIIKLAGWIAPLLWLGAIWGLSRIYTYIWDLHNSEWLRTFIAVLFSLMIWKIVTVL
ncbi:MAG TPA: hypothetical protein PK002_02740 [Cellvibrio sp.]|nr:hypothetical protein [Cellvibrio sp.]